VPEENLTFVDWVRWVPDLPLPITKVVAKYGKYSKSGTSDDFTPYKAWVGRGITAIVSEDGKYVHYLDFEFTQKENDEGYKKRFGSYPNQKEEKKSPKKSQSKDKRMGI
jgi:hypothetical protein